MRLQLKQGDLVRNIWTNELFVVISQGYEGCTAHDTKGTVVKLKKWDLEVYDGINKWKGHKKADWVE